MSDAKPYRSLEADHAERVLTPNIINRTLDRWGRAAGRMIERIFKPKYLPWPDHPDAGRPMTVEEHRWLCGCKRHRRGV